MDRKKVGPDNVYFLILDREEKFAWFENPQLVTKVIGKKLGIDSDVIQNQSDGRKKETFIIHTLQPIMEEEIRNILNALYEGGLGKFHVSKSGTRG